MSDVHLAITLVNFLFVRNICWLNNGNTRLHCVQEKHLMCEKLKINE